MELHYNDDIVNTIDGHSMSVSAIAVERTKSACSKCLFYRDRDMCYKLNKDSVLGPCKSEDRGDGKEIFWINYDTRSRKEDESFRIRYGKSILVTEFSDERGYNKCSKCYFFDKSSLRCSGSCYSIGNCNQSTPQVFKRVNSLNNGVRIYGNTITFNLNEFKRTICEVCPYHSTIEPDCDLSESEICMYNFIINRNKK